MLRAISATDFYRSLPANCKTSRDCPRHSDLHRTRQVIALHQLDLLLTSLHPGISEWYSPVVPGSGLHPRPGSASSLQTYFSEIDPSWSTVWYPSRKGEDIGEVHSRIDGFLGVFIPEVNRRCSGKHSHILLVSHAATVITLARSLLGNRDLPLRVGCCSLSEFTRATNAGERTPSWTAVRLADGSHLKDGASRDWGFEDVETARGRVSDVCCIFAILAHHKVM